MTYPRIYETGQGYVVDGPAIPGQTVPLPLWAVNTPYPAGNTVVAPNGQIVQAPAGGVPPRGVYTPSDGWIVLNDTGSPGGGGSSIADGTVSTTSTYFSTKIEALSATKVSTPSGGSNGQALLKSGSSVVWGSAGTSTALDGTVRSAAFTAAGKTVHQVDISGGSYGNTNTDTVNVVVLPHTIWRTGPTPTPVRLVRL